MNRKNLLRDRDGKAFQVIVLVVIPLVALAVVGYFFFFVRDSEPPPPEEKVGVSLPELWAGATKRVDNARGVYRDGLNLKREDKKEEAQVKIAEAMRLFDASIGDAEGILEENARVLEERDGYTADQAREANKKFYDDVANWRMEANDCRSVLKSLQATEPEGPIESDPATGGGEGQDDDGG